MDASGIAVEYADPDAVYTIFGLWRVYLHNGQVLQIVEGRAADVGRSWIDAW